MGKTLTLLGLMVALVMTNEVITRVSEYATKYPVIGAVKAAPKGARARDTVDKAKLDYVLVKSGEQASEVSATAPITKYEDLFSGSDKLRKAIGAYSAKRLGGPGEAKVEDVTAEIRNMLSLDSVSDSGAFINGEFHAIGDSFSVSYAAGDASANSTVVLKYIKGTTVGLMVDQRPIELHYSATNSDLPTPAG